MIFNSLPFIYFILLFFLIYWFLLKNHLKAQNLFLLLANYVFYAWSDWRFLSYLIGISLLNYLLGIYIEKAQKQGTKRLLLYVGLLQGIGGLVFFKYYNFFVQSFDTAFQLMGIKWNLTTLSLIIPMGISFFTFRTISYIIDIYNEDMKPTRDVVVFFAFVSFFPSLLSGPIDRGRTFIPQLERKRVFNYNQFIDGLRQILWGLFKKVVIADNCATYTTNVFDLSHHAPAISILLAAFMYAIQLYADFSGYSDMAIGIGRLFGINVTKNFNFPFFSQNISEFWKRWHMSLTSWLIDYVFTPLSFTFRKYGKFGLILAIIINFTICGLWHGANWKYVFFGFLNGLYFIPLILKGTLNKINITSGKLIPTLREFINMLGFFTLISVSLIIFRSNSIGEALHIIASLFSLSLFTIPVMPAKPFLFAIIMLAAEWLHRDKDFGLQIDYIKYPVLRWSIYYSILLCILLFEAGNATFIYAQF